MTADAHAPHSRIYRNLLSIAFSLRGSLIQRSIFLCYKIVLLFPWALSYFQSFGRITIDEHLEVYLCNKQKLSQM